MIVDEIGVFSYIGFAINDKPLNAICQSSFNNRCLCSNVPSNGEFGIAMYEGTNTFYKYDLGSQPSKHMFPDAIAPIEGCKFTFKMNCDFMNENITLFYKRNMICDWKLNNVFFEKYLFPAVGNSGYNAKYTIRA